MPFSSEVTLVALLAKSYPTVGLWAVATLGNTLGAVVNWVLGRYLIHLESKPWFPFKRHQRQRAQGWFQQYGKWSLLFAWLPIVGDALTFLAGVMRVPFAWLIVLTAIGKGARYAVVIAVYFGVLS
ncbi:YqaA family protein [Marinibactrum halimedae]|uniref:YqaA family protein n=1 Tax=Marinibactrum halimedae TaxID=1444977 RepID=UPI001E601DD0|nr:YqaA family protein [Marinibactrum halimedae]MCD9458175.1 DedA family protein [Marinibactrum halimedae]